MPEKLAKFMFVMPHAFNCSMCTSERGGMRWGLGEIRPEVLLFQPGWLIDAQRGAVSVWWGRRRVDGGFHCGGRKLCDGLLVGKLFGLKQAILDRTDISWRSQHRWRQVLHYLHRPQALTSLDHTQIRVMCNNPMKSLVKHSLCLFRSLSLAFLHPLFSLIFYFRLSLTINSSTCFGGGVGVNLKFAGNP